MNALLHRLKAFWRSLFDESTPSAAADSVPLAYPSIAAPPPPPPPPPPPHPPDVQAALDRIAQAKADELPQIVTRRHKDWETGVETVVRQDGSPLSVIDQAIMARAAELRRQAGGQ